MRQKNKGCLYWDESSRGYHGNEGHTPYKRGRWVAEKRIDGRLVRKRSTDMQKCLDFLNDCDEIDERKPQTTVEVSTFYDRRFMVHKNNKASMEQRKQVLQDRIKESELTLKYFETRDFTDINRHIEKVVLPRLNLYCTTRLFIGRNMRHVILDCIAVLYMYLYADQPVFYYEAKLRSMLRYYKEHGNLGYYANIPEPVHQAVDTLDVSALEKKFVVRRQK